MTRAEKLNRLSVLGHLGHSPHQPFAALLDIPEHELLHIAERASGMTPQWQLIRLQQVIAHGETCELALLRQFSRIPEHLILTEVRRVFHT